MLLVDLYICVMKEETKKETATARVHKDVLKAIKIHSAKRGENIIDFLSRAAKSQMQSDRIEARILKADK